MTSNTHHPMQAQDVADLIAKCNEARRLGERDAKSESLLEDRFQPAQRLAVYGSLAPGEKNYNIVRDVGGAWGPGWIFGELEPSGWGFTMGYPAFRSQAEGQPVACLLLRSKGLERFWNQLDQFEGEEYLRTLVPVRLKNELWALANCYELHPRLFGSDPSPA
ncbi:MAG: gamma-glutamylcyclotransferase [Candidatus Eisenbacteria bacterium]|uniref:Gamma-glutamylcyclotransferase n=1 Tax=Eiseniibacteriota bacterium TaxID=2212470 RepID=A0A7Y2E8D9_UNCEI|nr:gamma-glutamylcyclotransferase [Candidatus Eisenbacteria bacterium]